MAEHNQCWELHLLHPASQSPSLTFLFQPTSSLPSTAFLNAHKAVTSHLGDLTACLCPWC